MRSNVGIYVMSIIFSELLFCVKYKSVLFRGVAFNYAARLHCKRWCLVVPLGRVLHGPVMLCRLVWCSQILLRVAASLSWT